MNREKRNHLSVSVIDGYDYDEDIAEAASHVGMGTILNVCAVIGGWGLLCLGSGVVQYGIGAVMKGWLGAIGG